MGFFSYPVLMAADILLYDSDVVPVGKDQIQHIEMARDIANTFNVTYKKEVLKLPLAKVDEVVATVPGTDGAKMSKSYGNTIDLFATPKQLKKQIMGIVTDSTPLEEPKDFTNCNIYALSKLFMGEDELALLRDKYATPNMGYGHFKLDLLDAITRYFEPYQEKRDFYTKNPEVVKDILSDGAKKARVIAKAKLETLREVVGLSSN